jgi:cation transport ATPase
MRDREKRLYCVSCKTYFTHPTESNSSKKQKSANETKTTISPTQPDTSNVPSRDKSQRTKQEQNINENRQQKQQLTIESQQVIVCFSLSLSLFLSLWHVVLMIVVLF